MNKKVVIVGQTGSMAIAQDERIVFASIGPAQVSVQLITVLDRASGEEMRHLLQWVSTVISPELALQLERLPVCDWRIFYNLTGGAPDFPREKVEVVRPLIQEGQPTNTSGKLVCLVKRDIGQIQFIYGQAITSVEHPRDIEKWCRMHGIRRAASELQAAIAAVRGA